MNRLAVALLLTALLLPACGGGGGGGGGSSTPFALSFSSPLDAAVGVARRAVVYLRFNRALDPATVNSVNIALDDGGPALAASLQYVPAFREVRIVPTAALAASTPHTITITNGLTDSNANPFPGATLAFTTNAGDDTLPDFAEDAAAGTVTTTQIPLTWTASSDASAEYDVFLSLQSGVFDFADAPHQTAPAASTGVTVTGLSSDTTYYFVVRPRDPDGNVNLNETEIAAKTLTSWSLDVWPIVQSNCRSCHTTGDGSTEVPDMDMSSALTLYLDWYNVDPYFAPLVGAPAGAKRIKPGGGTTARNESFVYNKIKSRADGVAPWGGVGMPQTGGPLSASEIKTFEDWILEGALDN